MDEGDGVEIEISGAALEKLTRAAASRGMTVDELLSEYVILDAHERDHEDEVLGGLTDDNRSS